MDSSGSGEGSTMWRHHQSSLTPILWMYAAMTMEIGQMSKINNEQRKKLAKIVMETWAILTTGRKEHKQQIVEDAYATAREETNAEKIYEKYKIAHEELVATGFAGRTYSDSLSPNPQIDSRGWMIAQEIIREKEAKLATHEEDRARILAAIWTAGTIEEAQEAVNIVMDLLKEVNEECGST